MDEENILDLAVETVDEFEFGFGATVGLALVVDLLGDFLLQNRRRFGLLQNLILAQR